MPPRGRYSAWEAGQLAGVSATAIGQWARRGFIRSSVSEAPPRVYSFQDVAEAMVVHELLDRGVPHQAIRNAIRALQGEHGDWPLTEAPLATEATTGRARVVAQRDDGVYDVGDRGWQQVIQPDRLDEVRRQLRRGGWVVRELPDLKHVEVDPERLAGRPTIVGHRIAAEDVAEIAEEPGGLDVLREDYGLDGAEVADARRWWREVRRLAATA